MQSDLSPIPIPPKQRWNDLRVRLLPPLTFLAVVVVICWMWVNYVEPGAIIGEIETVHSDIISTVAGTVQELKVDRLEPVTNGQALAVIASLDADQLKAELAAAEADLHLMKTRIDVDRTRNLDSFGQLQANLLDEQLSLELARIRHQQAEAEYTRAKQLFESQLIPSGSASRDELGLEVAQRDRDSFRAEIASREKTVAQLEQTVNELKASGSVKISPADEAIERSIQAQRERIQQLQKPMVLSSPIDGFISQIDRRAGDRVDRGGKVVVVSGHHSDRVIGWVHTPVTQRPNVGDIVEVRPMGFGQSVFQGTVIQVGSQLEPVDSMLQTPVANPERIEVGLPLLVKAPEALRLIPGEAVQLRILRSVREGKAN